MHVTRSRAGRMPLALTLTALAVLGACADDSTAPTFSAPLRPNAAVGDVFVVTNTNDSGIGSLRWALKFTTGGEIIRFDPSVAGQTIAIDSTIYLQKSVTIEGPAGAGITINAGGKTRLFRADFTGAVTFRNLSLTGAKPLNSVGGVVYGNADLTFDHSVLYGNDADAGIALVGGNITLINSTVTGTTASTGSADYPAVFGDTVLLVNSTVAHNAWGGVGAGGSAGRVVLRNSIVSDNGGANCVKFYYTVTIAREGANISDDDACGGPSEIIIADPKLGALADNGGPTKTHALLAGSPAINAGTNCTEQVDQRYMARDSQCDIGAFEFADFTTVTITIDGSSAVNQSNGWATLTGTVTCSRSETFSLRLSLKQEQRTGKATTEALAHATEPVSCGTTPRPWSGSMVLDEGEFVNGAATATAYTVEAQAWVATGWVSAPVKLYRARK